MNNQAKEIISEHAKDMLENLKGSSIESSDLHHHLFNEVYFVIGYYQAEQMIKKLGFGIFESIEYVQDYERENFGETSTGTNSESICNMLAYILGEELLSSSNVLNRVDRTLDDEDLEEIIQEL